MLVLLERASAWTPCTSLQRRRTIMQSLYLLAICSRHPRKAPTPSIFALPSPFPKLHQVRESHACLVLEDAEGHVTCPSPSLQCARLPGTLKEIHLIQMREIIFIVLPLIILHGVARYQHLPGRRLVRYIRIHEPVVVASKGPPSRVVNW